MSGKDNRFGFCFKVRHLGERLYDCWQWAL
jgi:hypothetical protein